MPKIVTIEVMVDDGTNIDGGVCDAEGFLRDLLENQSNDKIGGPIFDYRFIGEPKDVSLDISDSMCNETYDRGDVFKSQPEAEAEADAPRG